MVEFFKKRGNFSSRRGISTIVGGAIFLVLFASAFSTFFIAMDFQRDTINTQRAISESIMEKTKEQFSIAVSADDTNNNRIGIQVKNSGTNAVEIDNIWIVNKSGNYPAQKHLINYTDAIIPPGYGSNILENTPLHFTVVDDYDIKVVSTLGTIKKSEYSVGAGNNLRAELIAIPPDVKVGQNVTLILHVENIGEFTLLDVQPIGGLPNISPTFNPPNPPVPSPVNLAPGEGVFFSWKYITSGTFGSTVDVDSQAIGTIEDIGYTVNSNVAETEIALREPDEIEVIVLTEDLISRPEMFMIIPSPFGDSDENPDERAVWGVNVVNPTGNPMDVSKVVISVLSPRPNSADKVFERGKCELLTVEPTGAGAGDWTCSSDNQVTWQNQASPISIAPYSVNPFLVQVKPGSIFGSVVDIESLLVQVNVFTTVGEFGKAAYGSSMDTVDSGLINVYHSTDVDSLDPAEILVNQTTISNGIVVFNTTLADFSTVNQIDAGSRLIINVPKGWTVNSGSISGSAFTTSYQQFTDTSSQIVGTLDNPLIGGGAETIKFYAQAPDVCSPQMYVMYVLADGTANSGDFALGPLAEILLRVKPVTAC